MKVVWSISSTDITSLSLSSYKMCHLSSPTEVTHTKTNNIPERNIEIYIPHHMQQNHCHIFAVPFSSVTSFFWHRYRVSLQIPVLHNRDIHRELQYLPSIQTHLLLSVEVTYLPSDLFPESSSCVHYMDCSVRSYINSRTLGGCINTSEG